MGRELKPTYCIGSHQYTYFRYWYLPKTFTGDFLWACSTCKLPSYLYWRGLVRACLYCNRFLPLPWETLCSRCNDKPYYRGIRQAAGLQLLAGHAKPEFIPEYWLLPVED